MKNGTLSISLVRNPSKEDIADRLRAHVGLKPARRSGGATVLSVTLDEVYEALTGRVNPGRDTYRKTEELLSVVGLTYDPNWDTSEHRVLARVDGSHRGGGGTTTMRPYSRILAELTGVPRCFLVPDSTELLDLHRMTYTTLRYFDPLHEAGPGSCVLFYRAEGEVIDVVGSGVVEYITPTWFRGREPWRTTMQNVVRFGSHVAIEVDPPGFLDRPSVGEIAFDDFRKVIASVDAESTYRTKVGGLDFRPGVPDGVATGDPAAALVAERSLRQQVDVPEPLAVPDVVMGDLKYDSEDVEYRDDRERELTNLAGFPPRTDAERRRDRIAEMRAISFASQALVAGGWTLVRDRQADGCGYDLLFKRGERELHVEVKGIQGSSLVFNLTPKERWRAETDPDWLLVVVLSVLTVPQIRALSRADLLAARWVTTGFRVMLT